MRCIETPEPHVLIEQLQRLPVPAPFEHVFALGYFRQGNRLQHIHRALKYGNRPDLGNVLGRWIGHRLQDEPFVASVTAIIPIPLARTRQLERGYNQSVRLAQGIAEVISVPVFQDILIRHRATRTQTRLHRDARWKNVADAFSVAPGPMLPQGVLMLVDDILTSGATATAAGLVLQQAGYSRLSLVTLGFAQD